MRRDCKVFMLLLALFWVQTAFAQTVTTTISTVSATSIAVGANQAVRNFVNSVTISGLTNPGFQVGNIITVTGMNDATFDGTFQISSVSTNFIAYLQTGPFAISGGGVISLQISLSPAAVAVNPATNKIYVADQQSHSVTVINGADNSTSIVSPTITATVAANQAVRSSGSVTISGITNPGFQELDRKLAWPVTNDANDGNSRLAILVPGPRALVALNEYICEA